METSWKFVRRLDAGLLPGLLDHLNDLLLSGLAGTPQSSTSSTLTSPSSTIGSSVGTFPSQNPSAFWVSPMPASVSLACSMSNGRGSIFGLKAQVPGC